MKGGLKKLLCLWKTFWRGTKKILQTKTRYIYTRDTVWFSVFLLPFVFIRFSSMLVVFVQPWLVWEENHPSFLSYKPPPPRVLFSRIYLLPTSLILDRIELYICVLFFWLWTGWPEIQKVTHPWNELWMRMNAYTTLRVSIIWTSVSILFSTPFLLYSKEKRNIFKSVVPPGCFRDWPPPFSTVFVRVQIEAIVYTFLVFRHVVCVH